MTIFLQQTAKRFDFSIFLGVAMMLLWENRQPRGGLRHFKSQRDGLYPGDRVHARRGGPLSGTGAADTNSGQLPQGRSLAGCRRGERF